MSDSTRITGHRTKPLTIYYFSVVYFLLPFISLLQYSVNLNGSGVPLSEILFSGAFLWEAFLSWSAAWAIFSVTRVGFFYFLALSLYSISTKIHNLQNYNIYEYPGFFLISMIWLGTSAWLLLGTLRIPYLNPRTQWWTQPLRYAHFCAGLLRIQGISFPVITLDISETGLFLKLDERARAKDTVKAPSESGEGDRRSREALINPFITESEIETSQKQLESYPKNTGLEVTIRIWMIPEATDIFPDHIFETKAIIVWVTMPSSVYRYGLGLKFLQLTSQQQKQLHQYSLLMKRLSDLKEGR